MAIAEGLERDPKGALERAAARFITLARTKGNAPHLRLTAALSDGKRLYAVRYATDAAAPSLYHRWSEARSGRAIVSEPLEAEECGWQEVAASTFCTFDGESVQVEDFYPCRLSMAA